MGTAQAIASDALAQLLSLAQQAASSDQFQALLTQHGVPAPVAQAVVPLLVQAATTGAVSLPTPVQVALPDLLDPLLPDGVRVPDAWKSVVLSLDACTVSASEPSLSLAGGATVPLSLAGLATSLQAQLTLDVTRAGGSATYALDLTGTLPLAGSTFDASADLTTAEWQMALDWAPVGGGELQFGDLCALFSATAPELDRRLPDLHLTDAHATLDLAGTSDRFVLSGTSAYPGAAFVVVDRQSDVAGSRWTVGLGVVVEPDMAKFPIVGEAFGALFNVGAAELLVATDDVVGFEWPDEDGERKSLFAAYPFSLTRGVAIVAIADAATPGLPATLAKLVTHDGATTADILLQAQLASSVTLTADLGVRKVQGVPLADLALSVQTGTATNPFTFSAAATIVFTNWGHRSAKATLFLSPETIEGTLDLDMTTPLQLPDVPHVAIDQVAGAIGLDLVKDELFAGLLGTFTLGALPRATTPSLDPQALGPLLPSGGETHQAPQPSVDELALVVGVNVDSGVPIPDVDVVLLKLESLSVPQVYGALIGDPPAELKAALGGLVLEDVLLYWSDDAPATRLPDGTPANPGFRFHGGIKLWSALDVWAELDVTSSPARFAGNLYLSTFGIPGVLTVSGAAPPADDATRIPADFMKGGPWITVDTSPADGADYLAASWNVALLDGGLRTSVDVEVSDSLFTFSTSLDAGSLLSDQFTCRVTADWTHLEIDLDGTLEGSITIPPLLGVGGLTLDLDNAFTTTVVVDAGDAPKFSIKHTSFEFGGESLTVPDVTIDAVSSFKDIPTAVLNAVQDAASQIFHDVIATAQAEFVKFGDDIAAITKDIAHLAKDVVDAVVSLFHKHHDHKPSWLHDRSLLTSDGRTYYLISGYLRRQLPDPQSVPADNGLTFHFLQDPTSSHPCTASTIDPVLLASLPIDRDPSSGVAYEVPSRVDGTLVLDEDGTTLYLIATEVGGDVNSGKYEIRAPATFQALTGRAPQQHCRSADIDWIADNSWLRKQPVLVQCGAGNSLQGEVSAFIDGVRHPVPATAGFLAYLQQSLGAPQEIAASAYLGIPAGENLVPFSQGQLVKCGDPIYLADTDDRLHQFKDMQALSHAGYGGQVGQAVTIDALELGLLATGKEIGS